MAGLAEGQLRGFAPVRGKLSNPATLAEADALTLRQAQFEAEGMNSIQRGLASAKLATEAADLNTEARKAAASGDAQLAAALDYAVQQKSSLAQAANPDAMEFTDFSSGKRGLADFPAYLGQMAGSGAHSAMETAPAALGGAALGLAAARVPGLRAIAPSLSKGAVRGGMAGGAAAGYDMNFDETLMGYTQDPTIRATKTDQEMINTARPVAAGMAALDLPVLGMVGGQVTKALTKEGVKELAKTATLKGAAADVGKVVGTEALTGGGQNAMQQVGGMHLDPTAKLDTNELINNSAAEAFGALPMGGAHAGVGYVGGKVGEKLQQKPDISASRKWTQIDQLDPLLKPQVPGKEFAADATDAELMAWQAKDDEVRSKQATEIAKAAFLDPDVPDHIFEAAHEYLYKSNGDMSAWGKFASVLDTHRQASQDAEKVERFGMKVGKMAAKVKNTLDKKDATKESLMEVRPSKVKFTAEDDAFRDKLFNRDNMLNVGKRFDDNSKALLSKYVRGYIESGFGSNSDEDGNVVLPDELIDLFGDDTAKVITSAADILRRDHGFKFDDAYVKNVKQVADEVNLRKTANKEDSKIIGDHLTTDAYDTIPFERWKDIASSVKEQISTQSGAVSSKLKLYGEKTAKELFGPNVDTVLQAFHTKYAKSGLKSKDVAKASSAATVVERDKTDEAQLPSEPSATEEGITFADSPDEPDPYEFNRDFLEAVKGDSAKSAEHATIRDGRFRVIFKGKDHQTGEEFDRVLNMSSQRIVNHLERVENKHALGRDDERDDAKKLRQFSQGLASIMAHPEFDRVEYSTNGREFKLLEKGQDIPNDFTVFNRGEGRTLSKITAQTQMTKQERDNKKAAREQARVEYETKKAREGKPVKTWPTRAMATVKAAEWTASSTDGTIFAPTLASKSKWRVTTRAEQKRGYTDGLDTDFVDYSDTDLLAEHAEAIDRGMKAKTEPAKNFWRERVVSLRKEADDRGGLKLDGRDTRGAFEIGSETEAFSENAARLAGDKIHKFDEVTGEPVQPKENLRQVQADRRLEVLRSKLDTLIKREKRIQERLKSATEAQVKVLEAKLTHISEQKDSAKKEGLRIARDLGDAKAVSAEVAKLHNSASPSLKPPTRGDEKSSAQHTSVDPTVTPEVEAEVRKYVEKVLGPKFHVFFKDLKFAGQWSPKGFMNLAMSALDPMGTAHHESLHELFKRLRDNGDARTLEVLENLSKNQVLRRKLERRLADHPEALAQLKDPEEFAAYAYQFWAMEGMSFGDKATTLFGRIKQLVKQMLGVLSEDEKASAIFTAFSSGMAADNISSLKQVVGAMDNNSQKFDEAMSKFDDIRFKSDAFFSSVEGRLFNSENPSIASLVRKFVIPEAEIGNAGEQGHLQAVRQKIDQMDADLKRQIEKAYPKGTPVNEEDVKLAMSAMQKGQVATDPVARKIQENLNHFFKKAHAYLTDNEVKVWNDETNGFEPIGYIENYFPRVWNTEFLEQHKAEFVADMIKHHGSLLEKMANEDGAGKVSASDVAEAIYAKLITSNGHPDLGQTETSIGFAPYMKAVNKRSLDWLDKAAFAKYQQQDFAHIMTSYVRQAVKRAEYVKRFGNTGEKIDQAIEHALDWELNKEIETKHGIKDSVQKARDAADAINKKAKTDADKTTWQDQLHTIVGDKDSVRAAQAKAGERTRSYSKAISAMEGTLASDASEFVKSLNSYAVVYQNFRLLALSLFSQVIDPIGIVVRGGTVKDAFNAFTTGVKSTLAGWKGEEFNTEAIRIAEYVGTIDVNHFHGMMGDMYASSFMTTRARKMNDWLFAANGMSAYNRGVRAAATVAAKGFIEHHVSEPGEHSERFITELYGEGVKPAMKDGKLDLSNDANRIALMRWVDGSILRPNAAQRPTWGSDPRFQIFFHMKSFAYAMHRVTLKRAWHEYEQGNGTPMLALAAGYVPMIIAADLLRAMLSNLGEEPDWLKDVGPAGVLTTGIQRAGLLGVKQYGLDGLFDPASVVGPTVEQIYDGVFKDETFGKTLLKASPASTVVRGAVS